MACTDSSCLSRCANGTWEQLRRLLADLDKRNISYLTRRARAACAVVYAATDRDLRREITKAYRRLALIMPAIIVGTPEAPIVIDHSAY